MIKNTLPNPLKSFVNGLFFFALLCLLETQLSSKALCQNLVDFDLAWDSVSAEDLGGYVLYWGYASGDYHFSKNIGSQTTTTIESAERGRTYYFAVKSYDLGGNESAFSNEISRVIAAAPSGDTDADGTPDSSDTDDDSDGLTDIEEQALGTNPLLYDTDGDGVADGQEVTDGTNPRDRGSYLDVSDTTICALWNSFLGMWNVFEHLNLTSSTTRVFLRLNDISGSEAEQLVFDVPGTQQRDILVHDLITANGLTDSYGKVCSSYNGSAGDVRATMLYYRPDSSNSGSYQYALALPASSGLKGSQFVPYNTFQPSFAPGDALNIVANWISVINRSSSSGSGTLTFYGMEGDVLGTEALTLAAGQRQDVSGHQFGASLVGIVKWQPDDSDTRFELKNLRYVYDNPAASQSFDTAFQIDGAPGSGSLLAVPLDTQSQSAILEISNTLGSTVNVSINIYDTTGAHLQTQSYSLEAYSSRHLITDSILNGARGIATIQGDTLASVFAVAMQYYRAADGSIEYMYGVPAYEAAGSVLRSSYNTFLEQQSELWLINPAATAIQTSLTLVRYDGTPLLSGSPVSVPGHGLTVVNLNDYEAADNYGTVTLSSSSTPPVGWVKRRRGTEFVVPTSLKQ